MTSPQFETLTVGPGIDVERSTALHEAIRFHRDADSDDPLTVVATAETFLEFLQAGDR